jgi:hypothetical protein
MPHADAQYSYESKAEQLAAIEQKINKTAMSLAREYMHSHPKGNSDVASETMAYRDQIYIVYKFLNTPIQVLVSGM